MESSSTMAGRFGTECNTERRTRHKAGAGTGTRRETKASSDNTGPSHVAYKNDKMVKVKLVKTYWGNRKHDAAKRCIKTNSSVSLLLLRQVK